MSLDEETGVNGRNPAHNISCASRESKLWGPLTDLSNFNGARHPTRSEADHPAFSSFEIRLLISRGESLEMGWVLRNADSSSYSYSMI